MNKWVIVLNNEKFVSRPIGWNNPTDCGETTKLLKEARKYIYKDDAIKVSKTFKDSEVINENGASDFDDHTYSVLNRPGFNHPEFWFNYLSCDKYSNDFLTKDFENLCVNV